MARNDVTQGATNSTGMLPEQKLGNAEELTYLSINVGLYYEQNFPAVKHTSLPCQVINYSRRIFLSILLGLVP
jgi:hypothetical protein